MTHVDDQPLCIDPLTTDASFVSGVERPLVANADFVVRNDSGTPSTIRVRRVRLTGGDRSVDIDCFSLYALTVESAAPGDWIWIPAHAPRTLTVSFPPVTWIPEIDQPVIVRVGLDVHGWQGEDARVVECPVALVEEFPA